MLRLSGQAAQELQEAQKLHAQLFLAQNMLRLSGQAAQGLKEA